MASNSMSMRLYYFVSPHAPGWQVSVDHELPVSFDSREAALDAAISGARKIWEDFRQASGVRIRDLQGPWRVQQTFGL